jgi:hypothetical protein
MDRLQLQSLLETLLNNSNVYFQPPPNLSMNYPCIVYELDDIRTDFAGNRPYRFDRRYQVTVIDRNPDSSIPMLVAGLPTCTFSRHYIANNLNHYVLNLYF